MISKKFVPYLLVVPILMIYTLFIGGGLIEAVKESLGYIPVINMYSVNLDGYREIINEGGFWRDLTFSVYLALAATVLSTLFGTIIAYSFVASNNVVIKTIVRKILEIGLILPFLYVVFLAMLFLNQTGFFSRLLFHIGIISDYGSFPVLIYDRFGLGILWVYVFKGAPFVALFAINIMSRISKVYSEAAQSLGADSLAILRRIYLPLSANTITWASSIIFAYDLGSFEVTYLLSGISPVPLSAKLYSLHISPDLYTTTQTMALNVILFGCGLIIVGAYAVFLRFLLRRRVL